MATRRIRPSRILIVTGIALAIFALSTWATDPVWARSAGLDVWNVGRLEDELRNCRDENRRLELKHATMTRQFEANEILVHEVFDGRRPLAEAAEVLWESNQDMPGFVAVIHINFRGPTTLAKVAHNILERIALNREIPVGRRAAELTRLRAEYATTYGVSAPETRYLK
jgi:hypothetical protein